MNLLLAGFNNLYKINETNSWECILNINEMKRVFKIQIKDNVVDTVIDYQNSPFSKEKTDRLWKKTKEDETVKKGINALQKASAMMEKIKKTNEEEPFSFQLLNYKKGKENELCVFSMKGYEQFHFHYSINRETNEMNAYVNLVGIPGAFILDAQTYFSKQINDKIIKTIKNHPKIRVRQFFL